MLRQQGSARTEEDNWKTLREHPALGSLLCWNPGAMYLRLYRIRGLAQTALPALQSMGSAIQSWGHTLQGPVTCKQPGVLGSMKGQ